MTDLQKKIEILMNLFNSKKYDEVITSIKPLLRKNPGEVILYNLLGLSLAGKGKVDEAIEVLLKGLGAFPNNIFILNNLGLVETSRGNYKEAEEYLTKALEIKKDFLDSCINFSNLKLNLNQSDKAIEILNNIVEKNSDNYIVNFTLGNAYQQSGEFEKSKKHFYKCLELNPNNTIADKSLSMMIDYNIDKDHYHSMIKKIENSEDNISKLYLNFAIGKAKEDMKDYKSSFNFIKTGNDIKNSIVKYKFIDDLKITKNTKELFSSISFDKKKDNFEKKFIFIVGMPRSGTTLIEQILSSHKSVYGCGELNHITNIVDKYFLNRDKTFFEKNINKYDEKIIDEAREYYFKNIKFFNFKEKYMTDKAPLNFRWIGFILKLFNNSKIINCKRDQMDICWSNYKNLFSSKKMNFSYSFENLSSFYKLYLDIMEFWNEKYPNSIYNLDYEKFIDKQKEETTKLLNFCDLEWDENCLNFHKNKKVVSTASVAQVRSPIYKTSLKKWEKYSENLKDLKNKLEK